MPIKRGDRVYRSMNIAKSGEVERVIEPDECRRVIVRWLDGTKTVERPMDLGRVLPDERELKVRVLRIMPNGEERHVMLMPPTPQLAKQVAVSNGFVTPEAVLRAWQRGASIYTSFRKYVPTRAF